MRYCRMRPFCNSNCGGCHDSSTDLGPISSSLRLSGGPVGPAHYNTLLHICIVLIISNNLLVSSVVTLNGELNTPVAIV